MFDTELGDLVSFPKTSPPELLDPLFDPGLIPGVSEGFKDEPDCVGVATGDGCEIFVVEFEVEKFIAKATPPTSTKKPAASWN